MSNIDDYFGGSKKRKVEKIDEDVDVSADANKETPSEEKQKSGNWDFLSGMFGIASGKKKEKPSAASNDSKTESQSSPSQSSPSQSDAPDSAQSSAAEKSAPGRKPVEDPVKALEDLADAPAEDKADLLTQIFSAGFGGGSDKEEVQDTAVVEEPKARGKSQPRGRGGRGRDQEKEQATVEESGGADGEADENFVEFEIEELDNSPIDEKEAASRGRSRRRPGGRGRGRGRNRDEVSSSSNSGDRPRKGRRPRRDWDRETSNDDSHDSGDSRSRDNRIPTWKEAIGGLIEGNIKSHSSSRSSRGGRGGKSRSGGGDRGGRGRGGGRGGRGRN